MNRNLVVFLLFFRFEFSSDEGCSEERTLIAISKRFMASNLVAFLSALEKCKNISFHKCNNAGSLAHSGFSFLFFVCLLLLLYRTKPCSRVEPIA